MKLKVLIAALAALFALQSGVANAATNTSRTSGKAPAVAKKTATKAAAKPVTKPKAVAAKSATKAVAAKKVAAKPAAKGKVASKAQPAKKAAARAKVKTPAAKVAGRGKAAPMRVTLRKAAPAALAVAPASLLADEADEALALDASGMPVLASSAFYVVNQKTGEVLLERNAAAVLPIASITKLMTAMVVLESGQRLSEALEITEGDIDRLKGTGSRLSLGATLTREDMLHLALMSSENRAASALARNYPGGEAAFVEAMNVKARLLGLWNTRFHDSTGLNPGNVSSPRDLAKLVAASASFPLIREFSTSPERYVDINGRMLRFGNTNSLVRSPEWAISVSKTGYISEAGRCLVMQTWLRQQPVVMVLMDSYGRYTRTADAKRVRKWLEQTATQRVAAAPARIGG